MAFKIGFTANHESKKKNETYAAAHAAAAPRRSVVKVYFPERNMNLAYYNDSFDLRCGDTVYVDGKLEGLRGKVTEVNYTFKIRLSDYKRVIAVVDTKVHGEFFKAGSHFVTFDAAALPKEQVRSWYMAPQNEEDEYVCGSGGDDGFELDELSGMNVSSAIAERGQSYYAENRVRYICLDGNSGYAIVEGSRPYEVEFECDGGGRIRGLTCTCYCTGGCKHEVAAMLQLKETLELISKNCVGGEKRPEYFAAIDRAELFSFAIDGMENGSFRL